MEEKLKNVEINDEELENVSGGSYGGAWGDYVTTMKCNKCQTISSWVGEHMSETQPCDCGGTKEPQKCEFWDDV